jgi:hypothetical protein
MGNILIIQLYYYIEGIFPKIGYINGDPNEEKLKKPHSKDTRNRWTISV